MEIAKASNLKPENLTSKAFLSRRRVYTGNGKSVYPKFWGPNLESFDQPVESVYREIQHQPLNPNFESLSQPVESVYRKLRKAAGAEGVFRPLFDKISVMILN